MLLLCAAALGARFGWAEAPHLDVAPRNTLYDESESSEGGGFEELGLGFSTTDDSDDEASSTLPDSSPLVHNQKETKPAVPALFAAASGILKDWNSPELPKLEAPKPVERSPASRVPAETRHLTDNAMEKEKEFQEMVTQASVVPVTYKKILSVITGGKITPRKIEDTAATP